MKMKKQIEISKIRIDGGTQWRTSIDQEMVQQYAECMKEGDIFPLMETVFDGVTYWLVDGFHRYFAMKVLNIKTVDVLFQEGTQEDAQVISFGVNGKHGKPRSREDKVKVVQAAIEHPLTKDLSDSQIAKVCDVSKPFVAAIRNPEAKERQQKNRNRHMKNAVEKQQESAQEDTPKSNKRNPITPEEPSNPIAGESPDESELLENQKKHEADLEQLGKFLDADDKMEHLYEENKRLAHLVKMKDLRITELMNEKNAAIKMVKDLQKQVDKLKGKK
jgi:ParB-like nuclease domain